MRRGLTAAFGQTAAFAVAILLGAALLPASGARAQEPGQQVGAGHGAFRGMQRVSGEVTAVSGANLTLKAVDGTLTQIVTTSNTRLMKAGGVPFKMDDLKVGDGVMAMGKLDASSKTLNAAMLFATSGAELRKMRENLGKTYIAGRVTAIDMDNLKMTVKRPDGVEQTIGFDETTSFKRGRVGRGRMGRGEGEHSEAGNGEVGNSAPVASGESITLADIKVGDNVAGAGTIKNGVFVPTELTVATPRQHHEDGAGHQPSQPATPPQNN